MWLSRSRLRPLLARRSHSTPSRSSVADREELTGRIDAMRVVVALGGNALLKRGEPMTHDVQRANIRVAAQALAPLAREHQLLLAHGNGPQVGLLALQASAYKDVEAYPLDVLGA